MRIKEKGKSAMISVSRAGLLLVLFTGLLSAATPVRGTKDGGGGTSVVCFSLPKQEAITDGIMTTAGRAHILSAVPFEYYILMHVPNGAAKIRGMEERKLNFADALKELDESVEAYGRFLDQVHEARATNGLITEAITAPDGLLPISSSADPSKTDAAPVMSLGPTCGLVYTIARQQDLLYSDPDILKFYTGPMLAVLQWHEDLSQATGAYNDAVPVQHFIIKTWGLGHTSGPAFEQSLTELEPETGKDFAERKTQRDVLFEKYFGAPGRTDTETAVTLYPKFIAAKGSTMEKCVQNVLETELDHVYQISQVQRGLDETYNFSATTDFWPGYKFNGTVSVGFSAAAKNTTEIFCQLSRSPAQERSRVLSLERSDGRYFQVSHVYSIGDL